MDLLFKDNRSQIYGAKIVTLELEVGTLRFLDQYGNRHFEISAMNEEAGKRLIKTIAGFDHSHDDQFCSIRL